MTMMMAMRNTQFTESLHHQKRNMTHTMTTIMAMKMTLTATKMMVTMTKTRSSMMMKIKATKKTTLRAMRMMMKVIMKTPTKMIIQTMMAAKNRIRKMMRWYQFIGVAKTILVLPLLVKCLHVYIKNYKSMEVRMLSRRGLCMNLKLISFV